MAGLRQLKAIKIDFEGVLSLRVSLRGISAMYRSDL